MKAIADVTVSLFAEDEEWLIEVEVKHEDATRTICYRGPFASREDATIATGAAQADVLQQIADIAAYED